MVKQSGILVVLMTLSLLVQANDTLTCQWEKVPLKQVLYEIEKQTGYTLLYDEDLLPLHQTISATYVSASVRDVLFDILKGYNLTYHGRVISISAVSNRRYGGEQLVRVMHDSVRTRTDTLVLINKDTIVSYGLRLEKTSTIEKRDTVPSGSHCLIAGIGVGYSTLGTNRMRLADKYDWMRDLEKGMGFIGGQVDVNYAFFWNDHWGISLGIGADLYTQHYTANGLYNVNNYTDTDHEPQAILHIDAKDVKEHQHGLIINMPVMLQLEYNHFYAAAGVRVGTPLYHSYQADGRWVTSGYYEKWDLELEQMHEYGYNEASQRGNIDISPIQLATQAELGVLIPLKSKDATMEQTNRKTDLSLGVYGNLQTIKKDEERPWQVGIKVGLRWKDVRKLKSIPSTVWNDIEVPDTTWTITERVDTTYQVWYDTIQIETEVKMAVVWFDFNRYELKDEALQLLDKWAKILRTNRTMQVRIIGHTCIMGNDNVNKRLSRNRANAVYQALLNRGVNKSQMVVDAVASSVPYMLTNHALYKDRRVEIMPIIK